MALLCFSTLDLVGALTIISASPLVFAFHIRIASLPFISVSLLFVAPPCLDFADSLHLHSSPSPCNSILYPLLAIQIFSQAYQLSALQFLSQAFLLLPFPFSSISVLCFSLLKHLASEPQPLTGQGIEILNAIRTAAPLNALLCLAIPWRIFALQFPVNSHLFFRFALSMPLRDISTQCFLIAMLRIVARYLFHA